jgi:hypothetical protein
MVPCRFLIECDHTVCRPRHRRSQLVPDGPQELFADDHVLLGLDATWRQPVDHADDAATELGLSDNRLVRIRGGAEDAAHTSGTCMSALTTLIG